MRRAGLFPVLVLLLAASAASATDDVAEPPVPPGEIDIGGPGTPIADRAVARCEVERFREAVGEAHGDDERRAALLRGLGQWAHAPVLREAARHLKDRGTPVAVAAVVAVARQAGEAEKAGRLLHGILVRDDRPEVVCAVLVGMGALGYTRRGLYEDIEELFRDHRGEIRKAAARYFGAVREPRAFRLLAECLDRPGLTVPPRDREDDKEAYWEWVWFAWKSNLPWYRAALAAIVPGETFETTAEARDWAHCEAAAERGIAWE